MPLDTNPRGMGEDQPGDAAKQRVEHEARMENVMAREYPPAVPQVCNDCPWRRVATEGWLGPHSAEKWLEIVHSEEPIACHQTIVADPEGHGDWEHPQIRQCRGAAIFRRNVAKTPRNPTTARGPEDHRLVFSTNEEFLAHHRGEADFVDPTGVARRKVTGQELETDA